MMLHDSGAIGYSSRVPLACRASFSINKAIDQAETESCQSGYFVLDLRYYLSSSSQPRYYFDSHHIVIGKCSTV